MWGDFTWWSVSDCEELVGHQIEHLGKNGTNYFMYYKRPQSSPPPSLLLKFRQFLHLS